MSQTNILITGGCGFLGTAITSALLSHPTFSLTVIDINPPPPSTTAFPNTVRYVHANILDLETLHKAFHEARPAIVVHTVGVYSLGAARYATQGQDYLFRINVDGTRNVLDAARRCGAKGLVYTSSVTVVLDKLRDEFKNVDERWPTGSVDTAYGISKAQAELLVLSSNSPSFPTCSLRSAPIFGPADTVVIPTIHALIAARQTPFILGSGHNLQDYVYIDNVADAHVLAVTNLLTSQTAAGQALFITNGEPVTPRDLCRAVWKEFGHVPGWEVRVPEGVAWWVGLAAEWVGAGGLMSRGLVSDGCRVRYVSIGRARKVLGYVPRVGLEEGIRRSCEAYEKVLAERAER